MIPNSTDSKDPSLCTLPCSSIPRDTLREMIANLEDVVIAKAGRLIARLVPWTPATTRIPGLWHGRVNIADDFDDFSPQDERD